MSQPSVKHLVAEMTFLIDPPMAVEIQTDRDGFPRHLRGEPLIGAVQPLQRWRAAIDWWSRPVSREYWRVLLRGRLLCEIYHDLDCDKWYVERIYD